MPKVTLLNMSGMSVEIDSARGLACILPISVGQPYHEGKAFEAVITALNEAGFARVIVVVADTLQRHTMQLKGISEAEAIAKTREKGKTWVKSILKYLPNLETSIEMLGVAGIALPPGATTYPPSVTLNAPCKIIYWDELLADRAFDIEKSFVSEKYARSREDSRKMGIDDTPTVGKKARTFYTTVSDARGVFFKTFLSANGDVDEFDVEVVRGLEKSKELCLRYILEECAATVLFEKLDDTRIKYIAYPCISEASTRLIKAMNALCSERATGLSFINIHFSGIDFSLERKKCKSKPPLAMRVVTPSDYGAAKAEDAPEDDRVEHHNDGATEEGKEKSVRPRAFSTPEKMKGSSVVSALIDIPRRSSDSELSRERRESPEELEKTLMRLFLGDYRPDTEMKYLEVLSKVMAMVIARRSSALTGEMSSKRHPPLQKTISQFFPRDEKFAKHDAITVNPLSAMQKT